MKLGRNFSVKPTGMEQKKATGTIWIIEGNRKNISTVCSGDMKTKLPYRAISTRDAEFVQDRMVYKFLVGNLIIREDGEYHFKGYFGFKLHHRDRKANPRAVKEAVFHLRFSRRHHQSVEDIRMAMRSDGHLIAEIDVTRKVTEGTTVGFDVTYDHKSFKVGEVNMLVRLSN